MSKLYKVTKTFRAEMAHILDASYASECQRLHGHSTKIELSLVNIRLNKDGMVIDFKKLKEMFQPILDKLDHRCLVTKDTFDAMHPDGTPFDAKSMGFVIVGFNPTAENIARWIFESFSQILEEESKKTEDADCMPILASVTYWETETGRVTYTELETSDTELDVEEEKDER